MIRTCDGEIFTLIDEPIWDDDRSLQFIGEHGERTIIEFVNGEEIIHVYQDPNTGGIVRADARVELSRNMFHDANQRLKNGERRWIVCDRAGDYVTLLEWTFSYYFHMYLNSGELAMDLLNEFDTIVLYGLNEFAVELYLNALPNWKGHRIVLCGEWPLLGTLIPGIAGKEILIQSEWDSTNPLCFENVGPNPLHVKDFMVHNEDYSRYSKEKILAFDELMTYTFCFANYFSYGEKNPNKKYFVIDGDFAIEGIFGIWDKVFNLAKFAIGKGFIPAFCIGSSERNMYSDYDNDDIWSKFMKQPAGIDLNELKQCKNVYFSPNANCLTVLRRIMREHTPEGIELDWSQGIFNENVENYIREHSSFVTDPQNTLGVLIRGTDYTKTQMPGHSKHASLDMIVEKIAEVEKTHPYKYIYLATEDSEVLQDMIAIYGDRLLYTDQERFSIQEGQLLKDLHGPETKKPGEGFRLGAEYLCTLRCLSMCESLVASGGCGGVSEAIRENDGKYREVFVFNLGINAR